MGNQRKSICTILLVLVNVIIFFALSFGGMTEDAFYMLEHGAMYVPLVTEQNEYYRIFTCLFLHFGFEHLVNNMLTLGVVGMTLEPVVGKVRFLMIYFVSGLGGNIISMLAELHTEDYAVSAGASGAIFGLTGALLCLAILNQGRIGNITKQGMLFMIGLSLYNGFVNDGVDNMAHVAGLISGMLITFLLCRKRYAKRRSDSEF